MEIINAETHPNGKIKISPSYRTNKEMIFACGDVTGESDSVVGAIAEGQKAARHIDNAMQRRALAEKRHVIYNAPDEETMYCSNIPMFYPQREKRTVGMMKAEPKAYMEDILAILRAAGLEENMQSFAGKVEEKGKKVAIAGGGISGITAAIALAGQGYEPVIFEKTCRLGGRYTWLSTEMRIDKEILRAELDKVEKSGIEVQYNTSGGVCPTFKQFFEKGFDAVLLAMGETLGRKPPLHNASCKGVFDVLSVMSRMAHEEIVDGIGQKIIVMGADELSMDVAWKLKQHYDEVTLISACDRSSFKAENAYIDMLLQEGINIVTGAELTDIQENDGRVESIDFKIINQNLNINVPCDTLLIGDNQVPDTEALSLRSLEIDIDDKGYPVVDENLATSIEGVFAIGDFDMSSPEAGRAGAAAIDNYLSDAGMQITVFPMKKSEGTASHEILEGQKPEFRGLENERKVFTQRQAAAESARCMSCGYHKENIRRCIGCQICMKVCPAGAIDMLALREK